MRILLVDPDEARRERVVQGLSAFEDVRVLIVENTLGVTQHVQKFQPDMVIVAWSVRHRRPRADTPARTRVPGIVAGRESAHD